MFCSAVDSSARGVKRRPCGDRVPEDISLITFHDADWTSVTSPPITVIDQPVYGLGKSVAELLIRRLKGDIRQPERVILATSIIERGSAPPLPNDALGSLDTRSNLGKRVQTL